MPAVGRGPVIGNGRVALHGIRVDDHFGFSIWPGFSHQHGLRLRRGFSHVKEYVGDDFWIGALGRCQSKLTGTLTSISIILSSFSRFIASYPPSMHYRETYTASHPRPSGAWIDCSDFRSDGSRTRSCLHRQNCQSRGGSGRRAPGALSRALRVHKRAL